MGQLVVWVEDKQEAAIMTAVFHANKKLLTYAYSESTNHEI